ncbi:low specificity L-threonine aldolase [Kaistia algarum]|uniref:threonine aldolase family protein n=1 Tax=Kaistia algarum TaxID=2083279 RepID=UPI000CE8F060|nr:beta-eliminating lyase-related protein [Kaistia algarum]MCX5514215.1 beta-eliminating lyase-related protein [Kaistia algarum]PPE77236.1 low specificity L-threonine aldolase [Kaistia algarum]
MIFTSDNWAGASDRVVAALTDAASGDLPAYGGDSLTREAERLFAEVFEREVFVFFVATGTAANSLALAQVGMAGGVVFCHRGAHIFVDEGGAPEFLAGCRLHPIDGEGGKLKPDALAAAIGRYPATAIHHGRPMGVSISQLTEAGTAYSPAEIAALATIAREAGVALHMDGSRFANALAGSGTSAADLTWRAGVDMLSFGGTKNGCFAAEGVVFFDAALADGFAFQRKRAGHLFSKSRFVSAQFAAYLTDGHWLELAKHANAMAARLAAGIEGSSQARLALRPDGNEVFAVLPLDMDLRLKAAGALYYEWPAETLSLAPIDGTVLVRLATNFRTRAEDVDQFLAVLSE